MYNNAAYMYPQQQQMHHQQMQQRHQMQMQQRQMQMQQQQRMQQQQQMQRQQQQQQIYQARKQQVLEKRQQVSKKNSATEEEDGDDDDGDEEYDEDEYDDEDDGEDDDEYDDDEEGGGGDDDDDESFSSLSDLLSSSASEAGSDFADKKRIVAFDSKSEPKSKPKLKPASKSKLETKKSSNASKTKSKTKTKTKTKSKSKSKTKTDAEVDEEEEEEEAEKEAVEVDENEGEGDANVASDMQRLTIASNVVPNVVPNVVAPARIPASALSPGEYMYSVISDVLATNNKKNFQRILARTPLPIALKYLHQIAQRAFATGNRDIHKVVLDTNKKYNIVSDVFIDAFTKGDSKSIFNAMTYLGKTVHAFNTAGAEFNTDELLKFFTPEFIAMNLIQSGNIEAYDRVMTEFKNEKIRISRGFHVAKALIAAYAGIHKFFSNQKRYTFTREIVILAICGGSTETLDYVIKKTKMGKMSHDIVMEARSCQPIPAGMMKHLVEKYNVSEMSV